MKIAKRKTVQGYNTQFLAAEAAKQAAHNAHPVTKTPEQRIAYYRDIIAAEAALNAVYQAAMNVSSYPGIVWCALYQAHDKCETNLRTWREHLASNKAVVHAAAEQVDAT